MNNNDAWVVSGSGPETYESNQVPSVFLPLAKEFLTRVRLNAGDRVLDVACGTGIVSRLAAPIVGSSGRVVGADFNAGMLDVARKMQPAHGATIEWQQADAGALPLGSGEFDVVLCQQGMQFFPDKLGALKEMNRVLSQGGRAALSVWRSTEHSPFNKAQTAVLIKHLGPDVESMSVAPFSLGEKEELRSLMHAAGFKDVKVEELTIMRKMQPPEISIPEALNSIPLGARIAALDANSRSAIVGEMTEALAEFVTPDGMSVPQATHLVFGTKQELGG